MWQSPKPLWYFSRGVRMASADSTDRESEADIQALIAHLEIEQPIETPNNIDYAFYPQDLAQAGSYFRRALVDWSAAEQRLVAKGLLAPLGDGYRLTACGTCAAAALRQARPPIYYWYVDFYRAIACSRAHATLCERLFGRNLGQDGFAEIGHLTTMLQELQLCATDHVLDLGCGNGGIAAYLAQASGAHIVGMDYIPVAIRQAQQRAACDKRLAFAVGNLDALPFAPRSFDAIVAVDSLYMPNDLVATIHQMRTLLRGGGRMGLFYSFALWQDRIAAPEDLHADRTPLGAALRANDLPFRALDFTQADYRHAIRKQQTAEELKAAFAAEGNDFLYAVQAATAAGTIQAIEAGRHARYLYIVSAGQHVG
jgi:SAM-dependent methyltransferase